MAGSKISGPALASVGAGTVFLYAGIKGYSIPQTLRLVVQGKTPAGQRQTTPITQVSAAAPAAAGSSLLPIPGSALGGSNAQNRALGQQMAAQAGWTGAQWTALDNLIMGESGWNSTIMNTAGSGAAGIAQNINGFGPGYERGNAGEQIAWLINYIQGRYGTPVMAYSFWLAQSPHWY